MTEKMEMKTVTKKMAVTFRLIIKIVTMTKWHDVDDDGNIVTMKMTNGNDDVNVNDNENGDGNDTDKCFGEDLMVQDCGDDGGDENTNRKRNLT